jgi:hypothetical protein
VKNTLAWPTYRQLLPQHKGELSWIVSEQGYMAIRRIARESARARVKRKLK